MCSGTPFSLACTQRADLSKERRNDKFPRLFHFSIPIQLLRICSCCLFNLTFGVEPDIFSKIIYYSWVKSDTFIRLAYTFVYT